MVRAVGRLWVNGLHINVNATILFYKRYCCLWIEEYQTSPNPKSNLISRNRLIECKTDVVDSLECWILYGSQAIAVMCTLSTYLDR